MKKLFIIGALLFTLTGCTKYSNGEKVETDKKEETKTETAATEEKNTDDALAADKKIYLEKYKDLITDINTKYDEIWEKEWSPAWESLEKNSTDISGLASNMENVQEQYNDLNTKIIDLKAEGLSNKNTKLLENYRLNFSKAISYRSNAAQAINQAIKGLDTVQSRSEEATKSIKLADKYMIKAVTNLADLEENLEISEK